MSLASHPASTVWEDSPQALIFLDQTPPSVLFSFSPLMGQAPGYAVEGANGSLSRRERDRVREVGGVDQFGPALTPLFSRREREQCTRVRIICEETTLVSPYQERG